MLSKCCRADALIEIPILLHLPQITNKSNEGKLSHNTLRKHHDI